MLNSDVLDEARRAQRLKDKCENKYSLYCFDVISTFDCALCVFLLQSLPFISAAPVRTQGVLVARSILMHASTHRSELLI